MASVSKRQWTHNGLTKEAWTVRYFDEHRVRRSKQFEHKKTADSFRRQVERELHEGTHTPDREAATYDDAVSDYLKYAEHRFKAGEIGRKRLDTLALVLQRRVGPFLKAVRLKDIDANRIERLNRELIVERGVSSATARKTILELVLFERFARRHDLIKTTPFSSAYECLPQFHRPPLRHFSRNEIIALFNAADTHRYKAKAYSSELINCIISLAALCGMRLGEILGLRREYVNLDERVISIRHSLTEYNELKGPKTRAGIRDVYMPDRVHRLLENWISLHYKSNELGLVFLSHKGTLLERASIQATWRGTLGQAGLLDGQRPHRIHDLRHFFASNIVDQDVRLVPALSKTLGHASIGTTMQVYVHGMSQGGLGRDIIDASNLFLPARDASVTQGSINT